MFLKAFLSHQRLSSTEHAASRQTSCSSSHKIWTVLLNNAILDLTIMLQWLKREQHAIRFVFPHFFCLKSQSGKIWRLQYPWKNSTVDTVLMRIPHISIQESLAITMSLLYVPVHECTAKKPGCVRLTAYIQITYAACAAHLISQIHYSFITQHLHKVWCQGEKCWNK